MDELAQPGDLEAGDVIALPDDDAGQFRVMTVRLGQGGFILRVSPANGSVPGTEREVTLTVAARLRMYGRIRAFSQPTLSPPHLEAVTRCARPPRAALPRHRREPHTNINPRRHCRRLLRHHPRHPARLAPAPGHHPD